MRAPRAAYEVHRRGGPPLRALEVEFLPDGWLRVVTARTRVEVDEARRVGIPVFDRLVERRIPEWQVLQVVTLADERVAA